MNADAVSVHAGDVAKSIEMKITVAVKGLRFMRARMYVGSRIMIFGAWVIGVGRCKIEQGQVLASESE